MKKVINIIISVIGIILSIICFKFVLDMGIVPNKYLIMLGVLLLVLNILGTLFLFLKGIVFKIFGVIIYIIILVLSILGIKYSKNTKDFIDRSFGNSKDIAVYDVVVLKNSDYKDIYDLEGKTISYYNNEKTDYLDLLKEKVSIELKENSLFNLYDSLANNETDAIVLNDSILYMLEGLNKEIKDNIEIIYSYDVVVEIEQKEYIKNNLKPINIYISGSDSRSDKIVTNSLSDVNMIMSIDPIEHQMLLTSIPRDYYVKLHGTTGINDKLTHAGMYGLDMSRKTLEDLFGIDIDYSIKVNMASVVKMVDLVGGIDIYSDTEFDSYHMKGWHVIKGVNHMDGAKALAYSRERYAYADGDNHRVRNQQQVLEAVFEKLSTDKNLLLKYDELLSSFSELYVTDIPSELISLIINNQLDGLKKWTIERQSVTGTSAMKETYSMPGWTLYVMEPNTKSVNAAKEKIEELLKLS